MTRSSSLVLTLALLVPADPVLAESPKVVTNSLGMKLAPIAASEFLMGAGKAIRDAGADEQPAHRVRITRPFHIGVYEVTQDEFLRIMKFSHSFFATDGPGKSLVKGLDTKSFPAEQVRFVDAVEFCRKLSAMKTILVIL